MLLIVASAVSWTLISGSIIKTEKLSPSNNSHRWYFIFNTRKPHWDNSNSKNYSFIKTLNAEVLSAKTQTFHDNILKTQKFLNRMSPYKEMSSENNTSETHASTENYKLYLIMIMPILLGSILVLLCRCMLCSCNKTNRAFSYTFHPQPTTTMGHNFQRPVNGPSLKRRNQIDDPPSYIQVVLDDLSVGQSKFPPVKSSLRKTPPSVHKKDKRVKLNKMFSF